MFDDWRVRLRSIVRRSRADRDLGEELHSHIERQIDAYVASGLSPDEARRRASIEFGGLVQIEEECHDERGVRLFEELCGDVRDAVRSVAKRPAFALMVVVTLGLGIGANTAVFSILDSLVLRPLPVAQPERLTQLTNTRDRRSWTNPIWEQIRDRAQLFDGSLAYGRGQFNLARSGEADFVRGLWVSGGFFDTLGIKPYAGRVLGPADDRREAASVAAVVSYSLWQRRFGGAADAVGRTIVLDRVPFTIVGIAPPEFFGPEVGRHFDVYIPLATEPLFRGEESALAERTTWWLIVLARLKPGETIDAATSRVRGVQPQIRLGARPPDYTAAAFLSDPFVLVPASGGFSYLRASYRQPLATIMIVVALVLMIACANVANLLLARASSRRHEMAVRVALGASTRRLAQPLMCESVLLAAAGAAVGLVIARWSSHLLIAQLSTDTDAVFLDLSLDWRVLAFAIAAAAATALLFGTAPAFSCTRVAAGDALKDHARTIAGDRAFGPSGFFVVAQVAVSLVLIVGALLFARTFRSLAHLDLGFDRSGLVVATIDAHLSARTAAERSALFGRVREQTLSIPGVASAVVSFTTPLKGTEWDIEIENPPGLQLPEPDRDVWVNAVSPGWFGTFGTPLIVGRDFDEHDRPGAPAAVVVNETFAKRFFPGRAPVGATVRRSRERRDEAYQIVGVARDSVYDSLREPVPPTMYRALAQWDKPSSSIELTVRPRGRDGRALRAIVAATVMGVDKDLSLTFRSLSNQIDANLVQERLLALVSGFFGGLAVLLAALGLYGVVSYSMARRRTEIGIRIALGSTRTAIVRMVLRRAALLVGSGAVIGAVLALWASRLVATLLYGLQPRDPVTLGSAVILLMITGAIAASLPAWRAATADPARVLREG